MVPPGLGAKALSIANFIGAKIKIERAKKHIFDLKTEIEAFHARQPYRLFSDEDPQAGQRVFRIKIREEVPPMWGAIVGDATHNLRSSLDLMMNELVVAAGNRPHRLTQFPMGEEIKELKPSFLAKIKGAGSKAERLIKRLKPYDGGSELGSALWRLHEIDIRDKHRLLVPVGAAHRDMTVRFPIKPAAFPDIEFPPITMRPADRQFPLKDGAEIYREPLVMAVESNPKVTVEIAFGEGQIFEGEAVFPTLTQLVELTERVVHIFERRAV
jgi:hypothetical protein